MGKKKKKPLKDAAPQLRILVCWRPDDSGAEALAYAAWVARTCDILVRTVTVFPTPWPKKAAGALGGTYKKWKKQQSAAAEKKIVQDLVTAGIEKSQWDEDVAVFTDGPSETAILTQAARDFNADLIVLGSHGSAPKGRFTAGSTADALLHSSPVAIGLMPRAAKLSKRGITRLTCAITNADTEDPGFLTQAADIADAYDIPLRIISVAPEGLGDDHSESSIDLETKLKVEWRESALALLDRCRDIVLECHPDVTVTEEIAAGWGWAGAIDAVKWKKGDLLYLASTPLGSFERVFIGSAASEILRVSPVPAMIRPARRAQ